MKPDFSITCGDACTVLASFPAETVQLTVTSPPYFKHRDYGPTNQIGQEANLSQYLGRLKTVLKETYRITCKEGACFIIVGDTYRNGRLLLVPHHLLIAATEVGWIVRNDIIWNKLDPPPESVKNRWRSGHEHIMFLTKRPTGYVFNDRSIRRPYKEVTVRRWGNGQSYGGNKSVNRRSRNEPRIGHGRQFRLNPHGCIPSDVWSLPVGNSSMQHYATLPEEIVRQAVLACTNPGDLVLDMFAGSGTTGKVAVELSRRFVGVEIVAEYAEMAREAIESAQGKARGEVG